MSTDPADAEVLDVGQQRRLVDALEHVAVLQRHAAETGLDVEVGLDAAKMRLVAAIECLAGLPPGVRDQVCGDAWPAVRATRNRIVHGYVDVDDEIVRRAVQQELPGWERALAELVAAFDGRSGSRGAGSRGARAHGVDGPQPGGARPLS